ncbi:MAG: hypothetical protein QXT63_01285, partial [Thermoplasmata archaeon]
MLNKYQPIMSNALYAMIKKELMLLFRGWRSTVFLACMAVVFIGITMVACSVPDGDYASPIEYALGPGSLMLLIAIIGCQFAFAIDSIVGEYESNTIA